MTFLKSFFTSPDEPTMTWDEAYALIERSEEAADYTAISAAITRLGKPFDQNQVRRAAPLVLKYLHHEDHVVRYQAIWFLGCWGKLYEYLPSIIESVSADSNIDNRAFAARCAGRVLESHRDAEATKTLLRMATAEEEEPDVRVAAYSALLLAFHGKAGRDQAEEFEPRGNKSVADFDLAWLASLPKWLDQIPTS